MVSVGKRIFVASSSQMADAVVTSDKVSAVDISKLNITGEAQGDIIFKDASNWNRLACGTSGYYLKTQGAGANPAWASVSSVLELVETKTLTGAGTTFDFTGLDINTDGYYIFYMNLKENGTASCVVALYCNNDTTGTNYYNDYILGNAGTISGNRVNNASICGVDATSSCCVGVVSVFRDLNNNARANSDYQSHSPANIDHYNFKWIHNSAQANITQLTFVSSQNLAIGSTISLYKLKRS